MSASVSRQDADQRVDLAPFGRDLTGVGEAGVVRAALDAHRRELGGEAFPLGREHRARAGIGRFGHGRDGIPATGWNSPWNSGADGLEFAPVRPGVGGVVDGAQPFG